MSIASITFPENANCTSYTRFDFHVVCRAFHPKINPEIAAIIQV